MKLAVCAVYDSAAECFGRPFFVAGKGVAIRSFRDEVNNKESTMYAHPDDYTLYYFGEFDDSMGQFHTAEPAQLLRGKDCIVPNGN